MGTERVRGVRAGRRSRAGGGATRTLGRLTIGLCGLTALLVAGIFVLLLISVIDLRHEDSRARRESDLLVQSTTVERSVIDLETGLRGYLLTRDARFLTPYRQAQVRIPAQLADLRSLSETAPERYQVRQISGSINSYMNGYARPLIATGGRLTQRQAVRATDAGKHLVDRLRIELTALRRDETMLRNRGRAAADSHSTSAIVIAAVGLGVSTILILALAGYLLLRILRPMRTVADAADRLAAGELSARVPELGIGEVAKLAEAFNMMASQLQARDRDLSQAHGQLSLALDEAREASTMKSNFLANMSHEIRTPLNGVIGMMDLLSETGLNADQKDYVSVAKSSGQALMMVVNDVLDIAKIEAGRLELEHRYFDLPDLVEAACDMVAATSAAKGLELQSYVHDDVPLTVRGDRMRVGQVLANLLSNAVKFTAQGEVVLEVSLAHWHTDDGRPPRAEVRFEVRDTGIGISPQRIGQLFEPFTQAEAGTTRSFGGTGLGLTIVRELTRMMEGTIEVDSEPGKGSIFACSLPLEVTTELQRPALAKTELRGLHVLIVDDNATNRRIFEAYTASWGMRPSLADSARAAMGSLELAAERGDPFDMVLLDLNMPAEGGLDLLKRVRHAPGLEDTRMIILTSSGDAVAHEPDTDSAYVLTKPVRQTRLLDAIATVMALRPARPAEVAHGEAAGQRPRRKVLVAEDQPVNWMLVERLLTNRGHDVVNAINGRQALEMLATEPYDLVLMDCQMPVLDGFAATRELRLREATTHAGHTPVVAMTANAMEGDRERCLASGMDDYLAKPITSRAIDEVLTRWLPGESLPAEAVLDPERMKELRSLFPGEEAAEMFAQLQREGDIQLHRIDAALERSDGERASDAAHRILSSARMVGAAELVAAATALQLTAREDLEHSAGLAGRVRELWDEVRRALDAELRSQLR